MTLPSFPLKSKISEDQTQLAVVPVSRGQDIPMLWYLIEQVPSLKVLLGAAPAEDRLVVHFHQLPFGA